MMMNLPPYLFQVLLIISSITQYSHVLALETILGRDLGSSVTPLSNTSASHWINGYSISSASTSQNVVDSHIRNNKTAKCAVKDVYCNSNNNNNNNNNNNRTLKTGNVTNVDDPCLLWDSSCTGNRTWALDTFFNPTFQQDLLMNGCFVQAGSLNLVKDLNCDEHNPPGRISEFQEMKNWMRSQQCVAASREWFTDEKIVEVPDSPVFVDQMAVEMELAHGIVVQVNKPSCCGTCEMKVDNVDIYYWPETVVNTSCLSIIGDSVKPINYGATTHMDVVGTQTATTTYWACNATTTPHFNAALGKTDTDTVREITTALIRTIGSLSVKVSLADPWSASPCTDSNIMSQGSNGSADIHDTHPTMHARGHTLIIPNSVTHEDGLPVSTVTSGNFTFTSPSIYANFHAITATDQCGGVILSSTMVAFAPGELSTIAGPLGRYDGDSGGRDSPLTTRSFDFRDLPCPPQSIMEENWYQPRPGEPYRPLIAVPSKLKEMIPWFSHCGDEFFTAYDPPSALTTATALIPAIPPSDPNIHLWSPAPSPTIDPGARDTAGVQTSTPVPAGIPKGDQPKETTNAAAAPTKKVNPDLGPQLNDKASQGNPPSRSTPDAAELTNDPKESSSPQQGGDPQRSSDSKQETDQPSNPDKANDPSRSGGNRGDSGQEADPKQESGPIQVSAQGSHQDKDPVSTNDDQESIDEANPFGIFTEGQSRTVNNQAVQRLSQGISIAGTTLTPGASPITISGTPIHFGSSVLVIGSSTIPIVTPIPKQLITTIAGQTITAAPSMISLAGTTQRPGAPGITLDGTLLSLNIAGHLIAGSKTISLDPASPNPITSAIESQVMAALSEKTAIAGTGLTPGASGVVVGGTLISLGTAGQLVVGPETIVLQSGSTGVGGLGIEGPPGRADSIITTIDGQVLTAGPTALAMAGATTTTLTPGAPGITINGTLVSLNTAAQLVVGSETIPLESEKAGSKGQTTGLGGLIAAGFGPGGPFRVGLGTGLLSPTTHGNVSNQGVGTGTGARVQIFQGSAASLKDAFSWDRLVAFGVTMATLVYMC